MTTDFRALCAELVEKLDALNCSYNVPSQSALINRARAALAQPEPVAPTDEQTFELADDLGIIRGHGGDLHVSLLDLTPFAESVLTRYASPTIQPVAAKLEWSKEREPCEECRYNHCIAETPFGRILISWKGWKDYPQITPDEVPWGDSWFPVWSDLEEAKAECEAEYSRRIALSFEASPPPLPVSERPWEREGWCDHEGQCWMGDPGGGGFIPSWRLCRPGDAPNMQASLPANALPLPQGNDS
jgi:hypothetical protein